MHWTSAESTKFLYLCIYLFGFDKFLISWAILLNGKRSIKMNTQNFLWQYQALKTPLKEYNANHILYELLSLKLISFETPVIYDKQIPITSLSLDEMPQRDEKDTEISINNNN